MKKLPFLVLAAGLASCGYTPLYAPGAGADTAASHLRVGTVRMENVEKNVGQRRVAQKVAQRLREDFPQDTAASDTLEVSIYETTSSLAVQKDATTQRAQVALSGGVKVISPEGKTKLETKITTSAPYNVENTPYGTESGKTYARLTAAKNLAEEIIRRMALYYRTVPALPSK